MNSEQNRGTDTNSPTAITNNRSHINKKKFKPPFRKLNFSRQCIIYYLAVKSIDPLINHYAINALAISLICYLNHYADIMHRQRERKTYICLSIVFIFDSFASKLILLVERFTYAQALHVFVAIIIKCGHQKPTKVHEPLK